MMAKQTVKGQQRMIDGELKIIESITRYYKGRKMPEYEKMYIKCLEHKIAERKMWIAEQSAQSKEKAKQGGAVWK